MFKLEPEHKKNLKYAVVAVSTIVIWEIASGFFGVYDEMCNQREQIEQRASK